ncbi:PLA2G4 [Mytilus coruscus]|uniref:PLA2G4 n=1 Tax=Mytilus coruscus TaxID=42192 RepID=A0A6J8AIA1_MYTCO|nr:PLA2G4 [Mytilus coruscus]
MADIVEDGRSKYRYQLYKLIPDILLVKLDVKKSTNIPISSQSYLVRIALHKTLSNKKAEKETTKIMALRQPAWNETLRFLVKKEVWKEKETLLLVSLVRREFIGTTELVKTECLSMASLMDTEFVKFEGDIQVDVGVSCEMDSDVKFRDINQLCTEEVDFVTKRKRLVFENMKKLGFKRLLHENNAPNIAIMGSGGGIRAVIGMCGAVTALQAESLLDSTMFTAGLSGSAWYLMSLYAYDDHLKPKLVNDSIKKKLQKFHLIEFLKTWYSWKHYTKSKAFDYGKFFTLTNTFGEMIGELLLERKCKMKWSEQRQKLDDGTVPLPLVAALHIRDNSRIKDYNEWIELSPYEVYIPKYGAAVDMKKFGDMFYGGFVTKEYGEPPIHYLQGVCGSAYAVINNFKPKESKWYMSWSAFKDKIYSFFNYFDDQFVAKVPNMLHGIPNFEPLFENLDEDDDAIDGEREEMMLADAGIAFNSPYPLVLHPSREIDVILSFDFSDRGKDSNYPFEELEKAEKWAKKNRVPFPELNLDEIKAEWTKGNYEEVYIFSSDNAPTIVHFVMINKTFPGFVKDDDKEKSQTDFEIHHNYGTMKFGYTDDEFDRFKSLVEYNVTNNKEKIVDSIQSAINRRSNVQLL